MIATRRSASLNFNAHLVLDAPRHTGLSTIALVPGRHVIGTAADCGIRLQFDGIQERHALILVGENRTVIKSMDPRTWVNDSPVSEMALRSGDRLSIGPLTFRIRSATREELTAFEAIASTAFSNQSNGIPESAVSAKSQSDEIDEIGLPEVRESTLIPPESRVTDNGEIDDPRPTEIASVPIPKSEQEEKMPEALDLVLATTSEPGTNESSLMVAEGSVATNQLSTNATIQATEVANNEAEILDSAAHNSLLEDERILARAKVISLEQSLLNERLESVVAKEKQLEIRESQLIAESTRIASLADATRLSIGEEHGRHLAIWQEWQASYQKMADDLATQFAAIEKQRESIQLEANQIAAEHRELKESIAQFEVIRQQFELDRQIVSNDKSMLAKERTEFEFLRSQQLSQHLTAQRDIEERRRLIEVDRQELQNLRDSLLAAQTALDQERQSFLVDSSAQLMKIEQESRRHVDLQTKSEFEHQRLQSEIQELSLLKDATQRERALFDLQRSEFERGRLHADQSLAELQNAKDRCERAEAAISQLQEQHDNELLVVAMEREDALKSQFELRRKLDEVQRRIESERQEMDRLRTEIEEERRLLAEGRDRLSTTEKSTFPGADLSELSELQRPGFGTAPTRPNRPFSEASDLDSNDIEGPVQLQQETSVWDISRQAEFFPTIESSNWASSRSADSSIRDSSNELWDQGLGKILNKPSAEIRSSAPMNEVAQFDDPYRSYVSSETERMHYEMLSLEKTGTSRLYSNNFDTSSKIPTEAEIPNRFANSDFDSMASMNERLDADGTLAEVNRTFGKPVDEAPLQQENGSQLPSWWLESGAPQLQEQAEVAHPSWVVDVLNSSPSESRHSPCGHASTESHPTPVEGDLRSKLAALFELPQVATHENVAHENLTTSMVDDVLEHQVPAAIEMLVSIDANVETPRESESRAHADSQQQITDEESVEDSVESFMARLLARTRLGESDQASQEKPQQVKPQQERPVEPIQRPLEQDLSHLMAEPKHKQNKEAVRENLRSFRQVAHLSARSALAKHSLRQLRNATIAKGVLLSTSAICTAWFLLEPLWETPFQLWKLAGCVLAAVLSGLEFRRSWKQLNAALQTVTVQRPASGDDEEDASDLPVPDSMQLSASNDLPSANGPGEPLQH